MIEIGQVNWRVRSKNIKFLPDQPFDEVIRKVSVLNRLQSSLCSISEIMDDGHLRFSHAILHVKACSSERK